MNAKRPPSHTAGELLGAPGRVPPGVNSREPSAGSRRNLKLDTSNNLESSDSGTDDDFWDPREAQSALEAAANGNQSAMMLLVKMRMQNKLPPDLTGVMDHIVGNG